MCDRNTRTVYARLAQIGLLVGLFATLVAPSTRELQILLARLLFHLETANTYVQGQPRGCVIYVVPNVQFQSQYLGELRTDSAASPEAFLRAWNCLNQDVEMPSLEQWQSHPLLEWATFELVHKTVKERYYDYPSEPLHAEASNDDRASQAWAFVRHAQREHAENGALWIAEAAMHFFEGRQDNALNSLHTAVEKCSWDAQVAQSALYAAHLLEEDGLPHFDAMAETGLSAWLIPTGVNLYIRQQLFIATASAVAERDDDRFAALAGLLRLLQGGMWASPEVPNMYCKWPGLYNDDIGLLAAMADRLRIAMPPRTDLEYEHAQALRKKILGAYL